MHAIQGLFFDLDGTLVDTIEADFQAYQQACAKFSKKLTKQMHASVHGMRSDLFLAKLFPGISPEEVLKIRTLKIELYPDFLHLSRPNNQLIDFLRTVRGHHATALVTTANKINAAAVLDKSGIGDLFDHVVTGNDVKESKPHPEAYLRALELTGLKPSEVIAFEDSEFGIQAARNAGIPVLAINIPRGKP